MLDETTGPIFRFEPGTTGTFTGREITFLRAASTGFLIEFHAAEEAEEVPEMLKGSRPDIEFVGRKLVSHREIADALLDGRLIISEDDYVFVDHSQTFDTKFVCGLEDRAAHDLIVRYATITLARELSSPRVLHHLSRRELKSLKPRIAEKLNDRIDLLIGKVEKRRRHPFRRKCVQTNVATAQTILRWDEKLRNLGFCMLPDVLHLSGNSTCKLAPEVAEILRGEIDGYDTLEKISPKAIRTRAETAIINKREEREADIQIREQRGEFVSESEKAEVAKIVTPSLKTVARWIKAISPLERLMRSQGPDWLLRNQIVVGLGLRAERLGHIVMIDEYDADVMSIIPFEFLQHWLGDEKLKALGISEAAPLRVIFSVMIDVFSGCILGLQMDLSANVELAKRTFEMCLTDKTKLAKACGAESSWNQFLRPEKVLHDAGNAYIAGVTEMLCGQLKIDKITAPKAKAFIRGAMERVFRTVHSGLLARAPGKTFSNVVERGDYDSEAEAVLTLDDLISIVVIWIVDVYHNTPNGGRDGLTPSDLWQHEMTRGMGCRPVPDLRTMTHVFGTTLARAGHSTGIRIMHANYSSEEYAKAFLRNSARKFRIRWWDMNLSQIQIEIAPHLWISAEVMDSRASGKSVDEWNQIRMRDEVARNPDGADVKQRGEKAINDKIDSSTARRRRVARRMPTEADVLREEERVLRFFKTPSTEISSEQCSGLYGVPVGERRRDEDNEIADLSVSRPPAESRKSRGAHEIAEDRSKGRRKRDTWKPGEME